MALRMTDTRHRPGCLGSEAISDFDSGITLPQHLAQLRDTESSLRSTPSHHASALATQHLQGHDNSQMRFITPRIDPTIPDVVGPPQLELHPSFEPMTFTPIKLMSAASQPPVPTHTLFTLAEGTTYEHPRKLPTDTAAFELAARRRLPHIHVDMNEIESAQFERHGQLHFCEIDALHVDRNDGRVYHVGHVPGKTFSGKFVNDDPANIPFQAHHTIANLHQERQRPWLLKQSAELLKQVKLTLEIGGSLIVERTNFIEPGEGDSVPCDRPGCVFEFGIGQDSYYLLSMGEDGSFTFCLRCFEMLWAGSFTDGAGCPAGIVVPDPNAERRDSLMDTQLNGSPPRVHLYGQESSASTDIHCQEELRTATGTPRHDCIAPEAEWSSPSSTMSDGEWRHPPTRFQHIAAFINLGGTLSDEDKAAVRLWKIVSRDQLQWERHLRKTKFTRNYYEGWCEENKGLRLPAIKMHITEEEHVDETELQTSLGVRKKDFQGRELSEVLALLKKRVAKTRTAA